MTFQRAGKRLGQAQSEIGEPDTCLSSGQAAISFHLKAEKLDRW
jgi:hypothetical protein